MPLSAPEARELIHTREVTCRGYKRADGLWDIEGHLTDVKTYPFDNDFRGTLEPGDPIHEMWVRMTVDDRLTIVAVEAVTDKSPFAICPAITPVFEKLVGLRVGRGFKTALKERVGGVHGCTHLVELFGPLATTAFQTVFPYKSREAKQAAEQARAEGREPPERPRSSRKPPHLDTCHALKSDGEIVARYWPDHFRPKT
ncbi:MAG: DUF2889 domain-containing protein [Alphaproteobacteria bacterium]|nr:DUF2889 domain-containing protein [Alphaproteobacteria bacterium]